MDKIFDTEVSAGKVVLVFGESGTLKSGFVYNVMARHLEKGSTIGLYVTLEESRESLEENMKSLGISIPENLHIIDVALLTRNFGTDALKVNYLDLVNDLVEKMEGATVIALDSLNALYTLMKISEKELRPRVQEFFSVLRQKKITSFVVLEMAGKHREEFFLADGLIELGLAHEDGSLKRYIQVRKMRAVRHRMEKFVIDVTDHGLRVIGELQEALEMD